MTVKIITLQVHPVKSVHNVHQTVETRTEIRYMEHPAERMRNIYVTYAEAENGKIHCNYRTGEDRNLQRIIKFDIFLSFCMKI